MMNGQSSTEETQTWYIAFSDERRTSVWWTKFLKKDFGHCIAFAQTGPFVTVIEPLWHTVQISSYFNEEDPKAGLNAELVALSWLEMGFKIIEVKKKVDLSGSIRHISNSVPTCVSLIKVLTGIRGFAFTPYQLYTLCKKLGHCDIDISERKERLMSILKPKGPDNSAQQAALKKQQDEADAASEAQARENQADLARKRRQQRGRGSLIKNEGGELGVSAQLGQ